MKNLLILCAALTFACGGSVAREAKPARAAAREDATPNTVRLTGPNLYAASAAITQITYGATHHEDRPHAIALVRSDRKADGLLAASRITHFPVNAPVLFVERDRIPPETFAELKRLGPDGNTYDNKVQIYLVGDIDDAVRREIEEKLAYNTRSFRTDEPFALSEMLDTWAAAVHGDHPDEVIIVQYELLDSGLPAAAWNAHMGQGLFFVQGETIPEPTRRALSRRFGGKAFIYLFGDPSIISPAVQRELSRYGTVQRVKGADPVEISLNFASFHDAGHNEGWWLGSFGRDFGWDIGEAGHNYTLVNPTNWTQAVTGSLLSHLGKHGPMILLANGTLNDDQRRYFAKVQPIWTDPRDQLLNHGWILGDVSSIPWETQMEIDALLEPQ